MKTYEFEGKASRITRTRKIARDSKPVFHSDNDGNYQRFENSLRKSCR